MRKLIAILLVLMLLMVTGCGAKNTANTIKDNKNLSDVLAAVDDKFKEKYGEDYQAVAMPMPLEAQYLTDFCEIDSANVAEHAGVASMSMTNSDTLLGVKAKSQKAEAIKAGLEKRLKDIQNQYEMYNVNGSYDRARAGEVYQKGDYLFLIVVGVFNDASDFAADVAMTKAAIDGMFN